MTLEELRKFKPQIQALARQYKIDPDSIRVFGSVARGEAGEDSDIDILVRPLNGCDIFDLAGFFEDMKQILHHEVDVISERGILPEYMPAITKEAIFV